MCFSVSESMRVTDWHTYRANTRGPSGPKNLISLDSSDYIGCFETDGYSRYDMGNTNNMKPCECVGYCLTKNSTFAGITYGYK